MSGSRGINTMGCLCIDGLVSGGSTSGPSLFSGMPGVELRLFRPTADGGLWDQLQFALQAVRRDWSRAAIMARDTGCAAALALAEQLPVDSLVLFEPRLSIPAGRERTDRDGLYRQAKRLAGFARRNLALCVSDTLIVEGRGAGERLRLAAGCHVNRLCLEAKIGDDLYTIREFAVKQAISCFLHGLEWPKPLAENSEMCIIYG